MQNAWWAITVVVLGGCAGGANAQGPGAVTDAGIDDASLEEGGAGEDSTAPQPEDGGMATVLDSPAVEWSDDAGYVNPGAG
jgi:hypothetical protein